MNYERIESGYYYHIYNQGNNKENIFKETMNYSHFLKLIEKYIVPVADLFSYCLLKNHFHLFIRTKELEDETIFSRAFSNLFNAYAKAINKKYGRTGSLFRTRFKRTRVSDEDYMRRLIVYINLNPIHHGFTNNMYQYRHSSLLTLLSNKETILKRGDVRELFDGKDNFKYYLETKMLEFDEKMMTLILE